MVSTRLVNRFLTQVFFSYINPTNLLTDPGFTEHSACPVYKGQKKIAAQWIRYGVDSDNPWDSFNTCKYETQHAASFQAVTLNILAYQFSPVLLVNDSGSEEIRSGIFQIRRLTKVPLNESSQCFDTLCKQFVIQPQ